MNITLYMYIICIIYAYMTIYNIDLYIIIYIIYINMTCGKVLISVQFHLELSFHLFPHNKPQSCDFSINFYCVARTKARKTKETLSLKVKCYTSVSQNHPQENHSLWLFCVKMLKGVVSPLSFPDSFFFLSSLIPFCCLFCLNLQQVKRQKEEVSGLQDESLVTLRLNLEEACDSESCSRALLL